MPFKKLENWFGKDAKQMQHICTSPSLKVGEIIGQPQPTSFEALLLKRASEAHGAHGAAHGAP